MDSHSPRPEGRPIVRRFVVKRLPLHLTGSAYAWKIRDRSRPSWLGSAPSHEDAIKMIQRILNREAGVVE